MVRQCHVCKKIDYLNPDLTFHRFPADNYLKKVWFPLLGFESDKVLPKQALICSNHFEQGDFTIKESGTKFLKRGSIPRRFQFDISKGSCSSVDTSPDIESPTSVISFANQIAAGSGNEYGESTDITQTESTVTSAEILVPLVDSLSHTLEDDNMQGDGRVVCSNECDVSHSTLPLSEFSASVIEEGNNDGSNNLITFYARDSDNSPTEILVTVLPSSTDYVSSLCNTDSASSIDISEIKGARVTSALFIPDLHSTPVIQKNDWSSTVELESLPHEHSNILTDITSVENTVAPHSRNDSESGITNGSNEFSLDVHMSDTQSSDYLKEWSVSQYINSVGLPSQSCSLPSTIEETDLCSNSKENSGSIFFNQCSDSCQESNGSGVSAMNQTSELIERGDSDFFCISSNQISKESTETFMSSLPLASIHEGEKHICDNFEISGNSAKEGSVMPLDIFLPIQSSSNQEETLSDDEDFSWLFPNERTKTLESSFPFDEGEEGATDMGPLGIKHIFAYNEI